MQYEERWIIAIKWFSILFFVMVSFEAFSYSKCFKNCYIIIHLLLHIVCFQNLSARSFYWENQNKTNYKQHTKCNRFVFSSCSKKYKSKAKSLNSYSSKNILYRRISFSIWISHLINFELHQIEWREIFILSIFV